MGALSCFPLSCSIDVGFPFQHACELLRARMAVAALLIPAFPVSNHADNPSLRTPLPWAFQQSNEEVRTELERRAASTSHVRARNSLELFPGVARSSVGPVAAPATSSDLFNCPSKGSACLARHGVSRSSGGPGARRPRRRSLSSYRRGEHLRPDGAGNAPAPDRDGRARRSRSGSGWLRTGFRAARGP